MRRSRAPPGLVQLTLPGMLVQRLVSEAFGLRLPARAARDCRDPQSEHAGFGVGRAYSLSPQAVACPSGGCPRMSGMRGLMIGCSLPGLRAGASHRLWGRPVCLSPSGVRRNNHIINPVVREARGGTAPRGRDRAGRVRPEVAGPRLLGPSGKSREIVPGSGGRGRARSRSAQAWHRHARSLHPSGPRRSSAVSPQAQERGPAL